MAYHASVFSPREAMSVMNNRLPDLPGNERRVILVRAVRVEDAPVMLQAITMKSSTWRGQNLNAVRAMADAYSLLGILGLAAFPARVDCPHDDDKGNLAWIRDCEEQLRQCAHQVGGSFVGQAIGICARIRSHIIWSAQPAHSSLNWIRRDAREILRMVNELRKSAHTLSEAADPVI